jgi:putative spermidine/putrescine transport system substrate-binding protein
MKSVSRRTFLANAGITLGAAALGSGPLLAACGPSSSPSSSPSASAKKLSGELWVGDYGGAFEAAKRKHIYDPFTKETSVIVKTIQNPTAAMVKAQVDSGDIGMDMCPLGIQAVLQLGEKYFQKLPDSIFATPGLDKQFMYPPWAAGIDVFATCIAWNTDLVTGAEPKTWADFWDTKQFPGPRAFPGGATPPLELALLADGVPMKSLYPLDVDRAFKKLREIKPSVINWWTAGAVPAQLLSTKQVAYTPIWDGRAYAAQKNGAHIKYTLNMAMLNVGSLVVTHGAPHAEAAFALAQFALRPDIQANVWSEIPYGPTNLKALPLMDPTYAKLLPTDADNRKNEFVLNQQWWGANATEISKRFQAFLVS